MTPQESFRHRIQQIKDHSDSGFKINRNGTIHRFIKNSSYFKSEYRMGVYVTNNLFDILHELLGCGK